MIGLGNKTPTTPTKGSIGLLRVVDDSKRFKEMGIEKYCKNMILQNLSIYFCWENA